MSEGNVYPCCSKKTNDGYLVWIEKRPRLKALGESLEEALEELSGVLCLETGDGEAVFDLAPARGAKGEVAFVTLHWNDRWDIPRDFSRSEYAELYEGGLCTGCCTGIGPRTKKMLRVSKVGKGDLLGPYLRLPDVLLASDRFRKRLSPNERGSIEWRPIEMCGQSRSKYFEVAAKHPIATVAIREEPVSGWQCPLCGFRLFSGHGYDRTLVAAADVPKPIPSLLTVNDPHLLEIAIPAARWKRIRGTAGMKGIVTRRLVLVPAKSVVRRPKVRVLKRLDFEVINRELDHSIGYYGR